MRLVSVLAIIGLVLARTFGWMWMDPLAGVIGALVIANWSYGLMRDTGAILLDMSPDRRMAENVRHAIEDRGDKVVDLHVWRVGPGHMSAVVSVATSESQRDSRFYHAVLGRFKGCRMSRLKYNPHQWRPDPSQSVGRVLPIATSRDSGGVCGLIEAVSGHDSMRLTQEDRSNSSWVCGSIRRRSREVTFSQKVVAEEEKRNAKTLIYAFGRRHSQFSRIFRERRRPVCKADIVRRESEIREPQSGGCQSFLSFRQWEIGIRCM
jgi:hypothetical protein